MEKKLDQNNKYLEAFKGFTPRWILPGKVRRLDSIQSNTSATVIIIDSAREVKLGLAEQFTPEIIGRNEIMVSESILDFLDIAPDMKEQVEIFFDLLAIV